MFQLQLELASYRAWLAHPGGNITGFLNFEYSMSGKWAELLSHRSE
jgi:hypothetical protein